MNSEQQEPNQKYQLARLKNYIEFAMVSKISQQIQRGPSCLYIEPVTKKLIMKNGINKSLSFGFRNNSIENVKLINFNTNGSIVGVYNKDMDRDFVEEYQTQLMVPYSECVTRDMLHWIEDGDDGDGSGGDGSGSGSGGNGSGSTNPSKPPIVAIQGKRGPRGYSAFEWWARETYGDEKVDIALELEANGDALEINYMQYQFMTAIRGEDGEDGDDGEDGEDGKNGAKKSIWEWLWGGVDFVEDVISDGALSVLWGRVTALEVALGVNSAGDAAQSGMNFLSLFGKGITNKIDDIADTISFIGDNIDSVKGICDTITEPLIKTSDFITEITNKPGKMTEFFSSIKDLFKSSGSGYVKLPEFGSLPSPLRSFKSTVPVSYSLNVAAETSTEDSKSLRTSSEPPTKPEEPPQKPKDDPWDVAGWEKPDMETIKNAIDNITWKQPKPIQFTGKEEVETINANLINTMDNTKFIYNTFQPKYNAFLEMYNKEQNRYQKEYTATSDKYDNMINSLPPNDPQREALQQEKTNKLQAVNDGSVEILQTITTACSELKDQKETAVNGNFIIMDTLNGHPISDYALKSDIGETENIQELKDTIKQQQAKIDELTTSMQSLIHKMEEHEKFYNPKIIEMWEWYSDIGKYIEDFNFCEMQALRDKVNEVYAWYEANGELSIEEFNEIKTLVDNIRVILDQHESQLLNLNTNVECFKTDVNGLLDQLTSKLNELITKHDNEISTINEKVDTNTDTINNLSFIEQNKYINQHYRLSYRNDFSNNQVPVNGIISEEHVGKTISLNYNVYFNDTNTITNNSNIIGDITWIWEKDGQEVATVVNRKHSKGGWYCSHGTYQFPQCVIKVTEAMVGCPTKPNKYRFVVIPQSQTIKDTLPNFASHISEYVDELKTDLTTVQSNITELITTNSSEHSAINERIDNLTTSNDNSNTATNSEISNIKTSINELITKHDNEISNINTTLDEHKTLNEQSFTAINERIDNLTTSADNNNTATNSEISNIKTSITELTTTNSSEHETINNTLNSNETRLAALEEKSIQLEDESTTNSTVLFYTMRPEVKRNVDVTYKLAGNDTSYAFAYSARNIGLSSESRNLELPGTLRVSETVTARNLKSDNETRLAKLESIIYPIGCTFSTNKKGGYPSIGSWSLSGLVGSYKITVRGAGLNIHFNNQEIKAVVTTYYSENGANILISGLNSITNAQSISGIQAFERSNYGIKINYNTKCVAEYKDNTLVIDPNYGSNEEWSVLVTAIFHGFKAEPTASMFTCNEYTATKCEPVGEITYIYKRTE